MTTIASVVPTDLDSLSDYSLQITKWLLITIGAWPTTQSTSKMERIVSLIVIVVCYCTILITVVPSILYVILADEDLQKKLMVVGPLSHWLIGGINYTTLLLRGKEIRCCIKRVRIDWRTVTRSNDQKIMLRNAEIGRYVVVCCTAFMQGGVLCYCVIQGFTTEIVRVGNETRTIRLLPCAAYKKLIPVDTSPTNEIILFVQFMAGFVVNSSTVGAFSLAIVFATHAYGQLNVLMTWITEFVNQSDVQDKNAYLRSIGPAVEKHLNVLAFISHIEDMLTEICFLELFQSTFGICLLGYYVLLYWATHDLQNMVTCSIILFAMSVNIFVVCFIGEKLSEQCKKVGEAVYMTDWYHLPGKDILDLILIISRSSVVTKITAGKIVHMSLYTFTRVMKTAFAYINVLRQTT